MYYLTVKRTGENIVLPVAKMMRAKVCFRKEVVVHSHAVLITRNGHHYMLYKKHSWCTPYSVWGKETGSVTDISPVSGPNSHTSLELSRHLSSWCIYSMNSFVIKFFTKHPRLLTAWIYFSLTPKPYWFNKKCPVSKQVMLLWQSLMLVLQAWSMWKR